MKQNNKIINILKLCIITTLFLPVFIKASRTTNYCNDCNYEKTLDIIQETMKAYYFKGSKIQYNFAKAQYGINPPENATEQDTNYLVCAAYTYSTLVEAFGMKYSTDSTTPQYNSQIISEARKYYNTNKNLDGNYLIYYENTKENKKYIYNNPKTYEDLVKQIKPGDLFVFTGHALIAYDTVDRNNDGIKDDVLILHSTMSHHIPTKIYDDTFRISYNITNQHKNETNNILNMNGEGTITWTWLSDIEKMVSVNNTTNKKTLKCNETECAVLRTFYQGDNNTTIYNYKYDLQQYKNSLLRTQYRGLQIDKTSSIGDNNNIKPGENIKYTIKVSNKSNLTIRKEKNYSSYYIEEHYDTKIVKLINAPNAYKIDKENGKIIWKILCNKDEQNTIKSCLAPGKTTTLEYTVQVINDNNLVNKEVISKGIFYNTYTKPTYLTTGEIKNKIVTKTNGSPEQSYETCYNKTKQKYSGLQLIDAIYNCVYGNIYSKRLSNNNDFKFEKFNYQNIFTTITDTNENYINDKSTSNLIKLNTNLNNTDKTFYNMILNNYWNSLTTYKIEEEKKEQILLPRWSGTTVELRARTIIPEHFKDGDILIYSTKDEKNSYNSKLTHDNHTNENGLYAYIFINGKFIGINDPCKKNGTSCQRNEFTYEYYTGNTPIEKISANSNDSLVKNLMNNFYTRISTINYDYKTKESRTKIYEFINYQTLYGKDYYVILRPELLLNDLSTINNDVSNINDPNEETNNIPNIINPNENQEINNNENIDNQTNSKEKINNKNNIIIYSIIIIIIISTITTFIIKKKKQSMNC